MASNIITKEIESRLKQSPEHLFEVFLEINQPIHNQASEILIQYPDNYSDQILKTAANFAYPCRINSDDLNENYTFVVLDSTGTIFRFGFCRRSTRESTCLCLLSYYPWFEMFYHILNDLSQMINSKTASEVECFLSDLYNYKLMSMENFIRNQGKELILSKYSRPDPRQLPSIPSNLNFSVLFSQLSSNLILRLFAYLLFERRILFVSSRLFHLTACTCACLHLIYPMHWQNIFLPILPESMSWTVECTAPFIIGVHTNIYSKFHRKQLEDVVIVDLDKNIIHSSFDDLNQFPKNLLKKMKNEIEENLSMTGDHIARGFLRIMAMIFGNYPNGFVIKKDKLDFNRDVYLQEYHGTDLYRFMSAIVNTQMFEQFSRYRTYNQFEREFDIDEFDIEVQNLQQTVKTPVKYETSSEKCLINFDTDDFQSNYTVNESNKNENNLETLLDQFDPFKSSNE